MRQPKNKITEYLEGKGFIQMVKKATHIDRNLIDQIYTNNPEIEVEQAAKYYSDHGALCVTYRTVHFGNSGF